MRIGLVGWLLLLLALSAVAGGPFEEADRAFNQGDLERAEQLYRACAREPASPAERARALDGLAAIALTRGQDAEWRRLDQEAQALRRALPEAPGTEGELAREGGFERGLVPPWGTGHYESGNFNFGLWWNSGNCRSYARMDGDVVHSGRASLRITGLSPGAPNVFGTTAQRIRGISPNTLYELSVWARAEGLSPGAVQLICDPGWHVRPIAVPPGTYGWTRLRAQLNSGDMAFIDLRILHQSQGTVWLDDLSLRRLEPEGAEPLVAAEALFRRGQVRQALAKYRELERAWAGRPQLLSTVWLRQAEALAAMGEYGQALALYERIRTPTAFRVWLAMGDIHLNLDQPREALEHFSHVERITREHLDQAMLAEADDRIAMAHLRLGDLREATMFASEALAIRTHINDPHARSVSLCHLGQIQMRAGHREAARDSFEAALPLARATGDRRLESDILTQRAIGRGGAEAIADLTEAVRLRREVSDRYGLIGSLYWLGHFQALAGAREAALRSLEEAAGLLESVKSSSGIGDVLLETGKPIYEELLRLNLQQGDRENALQAVERFRREELRRLFQDQGASLSDPELETHRALQGEREAVERVLEQELSRPAAEQNAATVAAARAEREKRLTEYREFLRQLFEKQPELAGLISVNPKQLRLKQSTLKEGEALLEFLCGEKELYLFLVTSRELEARVVALPRAELARRVSALRLAIFRDQADSYRPLAHQLYRDLLGPVASQLESVRTLAILPNGPLHYLPFQVLVPDPARPDYLVDRLTCVNLCEESFLAPPRAAESPRRLLLLGNPDGTLPGTEREVAAIAELIPGSRVFLRETARKELVAGGGYDGLHIASHGVLNGQDAAGSYIQLAGERLTVREIWGLDLKGLDLVSLSACQTALGETLAGDDMISLENAFFFAGATSVVASLWKVDDTATMLLMTEFYRNLKTMSRSHALQEAQRSVKARRPRPLEWAPFILIGPVS